MQNERLVGAAYVAVSAAAFGAMAIFARFASGSGADVVTVLFLRFLISAVLMSAVMLATRRRWPSAGNAAVLVAMGGIGYVAQSYAFFEALNFASAGLVALLLYLYPILVTLLGAVFLRQRLTRGRVVAVLTALAGTALTIGGELSGRPLGIILGVAAALIYSIYILVGNRVMAREAPLASATVVMMAAAAVYGGLVGVAGATWPQGVTGWVAVLLIAIVSTVIAMVSFFIGLQKLGAADAASLSTLEPVVTFVLAAIFLGEAIEFNQVIGGAVILAAVIWLARHPPAAVAGARG
ncbi:DMT family transporter [Aromatoleum petrolei]|uniref:EamA family transporter n=1 Tax=Aromatoleum petrolei TaxID=76116 RepID=A0ABX1MUI1_9RHOO|nr:DMT family transporter [Aromatoleum petrolei]NMF89619.1 EamA family transporter [Aromatoleum petrolei]QTQ39057.1 EamA domain-containing protein [Aromatoleum petrolei]